MKSLIPRKLHQIWMGGEMPEREQWLCSSVRQIHPDWEYKFWTDASCFADLPVPWHRALWDRWVEIPKVCDHPTRMWAFRSDILRLAVLWVYGGFYLDCDMFAVRPLDDLCENDLVLMQFRPPNHVGEGLIGAVPRSDKIARVIENYLSRPLAKLMGLNLGMLSRHHGWKSWDTEYFCPHPRLNPGDLYRCTGRTYTIHCWRDCEYDRERLIRLRPAAVEA